MFVERLTDSQIQQFRMATDLRDSDGNLVNYRIHCSGKFYSPANGYSCYIMFLRDFNCTISFADEKTNKRLKQHYIKFMRKIFKEEYDEQLTIRMHNNINDFEV